MNKKEGARNQVSIMGQEEGFNLLNKYGIPVTQFKVSDDPDEVVNIACSIGFPVTVKGITGIMHKSDAGYVKLSLETPKDVEEAVSELLKTGKAGVRNFLVQKHVSGRRELIAGMFRDDAFGPVVMFGIGGIFTQVIEDVVFRIAPVSKKDAEEIIHEIQYKNILGVFRGEPEIDKNDLVATLCGISDIAMEHPDISEIDINPLIINNDGRAIAVDVAMARTETNASDTMRKNSSLKSLRSFFHPESIAVVGASEEPSKWGYMLSAMLKGSGFRGKLYFINKKGGSLFGEKIYEDISMVPDKIDLACLTVPAPQVVSLLQPLSEKGVSNVIVISSGFSETGNNGAELEKQLLKEASERGISFLGPNLMGIGNFRESYNLTLQAYMPDPGDVSIVSHSGNVGVMFLSDCKMVGAGVNLFCTLGNETMIDLVDIFRSFDGDEHTRVIGGYLEHIRNPREFLEVSRKISRKKPIVVLKGGQTGIGGKAAASHTGGMVQDNRVFSGMCRQAGIIKVDQMVGLVDTVAAFSYLPLPAGSRVAVMTTGGGWGVIAADWLVRTGLNVPDLSKEVARRLDGILPKFWNRGNPVDMVFTQDKTIPLKVLEELLQWDGCDAVIHLGLIGHNDIREGVVDCSLHAGGDYTEKTFETIHKKLRGEDEENFKKIAELMVKYNKPVIGVGYWMNEGTNRLIYHTIENRHLGCVIYPTPERAALVLSRLVEYSRNVKS